MGGEIQTLGLPQGGVVLSHPVAWVNPADASRWVFVANGNGISGLRFTVSAGVPLLAAQWNRAPGGGSPVIANGILYYLTSNGLYALDPVTGTTLWSNASPGGVHWESPIVVNGKVFVTDESSRFWAFGVPKDLALYRTSTSRFFADFNFDHVVDLKTPFGASGDKGLAGDVDGDGMTDLVLYRNGLWYIDTTRTGNANLSVAFGGLPGDVPLLGDLDGDGKVDLVIFRAGVWYATTGLDSTADLTYLFGTNGDVPLIGDINGDGKADLIVYRNGLWYGSTKRDGVADVVVAFGGLPGDIPMAKLIQGGVDITAVHNHLLRANPETFYMHIGGHVSTPGGRAHLTDAPPTAVTPEGRAGTTRHRATLRTFVLLA